MTSWPGEFYQNESSFFFFFYISPFQDLMNHY